MANIIKDLNVDKIIKDYNDGWSIQSISNNTGVSHSVIKKRLLWNGIILRSSGESVKLMYKKEPYKWKGKRIISLNENFFNTLTPESAYILGIIQSDGNIRYKPKYRLVLAFKIGDAEFLHTIISTMGAGHRINVIDNKFGVSARVEISSKKLIDSIIKWNITPNKSFTATTHTDLLLNKDYWRGVIDGDGTLCYSSSKEKILSLVGSKYICGEFLSFCKYNGYSGHANVNKHKNIFSIAIKNKEAIRIATILYKDAILYLPRKMDKYKQHFNGEI